MPQPVPDDPLDELIAGLKRTAAIKGTAHIVDSDKAATAAPKTIVLTPVDGEVSQPARSKRPSLIDFDVTVEAAVWGESRAHCWFLLRRLAQGIAENEKAGGSKCEWRRLQFDTTDDTGAQGAPLLATFVIRSQPLEPPTAPDGLIETYSIAITKG